MAETCFPVFQEGQTLTRDDLNRLRAFLDDRGRMLGRSVGFGINCGLTGSVTSEGLRIDPGIAIDQNGEVLLLPEANTIAVPPTAESTFEFVTGTDGFTPVLVVDEEEIATPECDEEGCEGHASLCCRTARVVVARGALTGPRFDFSSEPLLEEEPLRIRGTGSVEGAFVALRNTIVSRLRGRISTEAENKLAGLALEATDLPAIRAYKAAFLNQVLFAALDYLRCVALTGVSCLRESETPGVALGSLRQVAGAWTWDCDGRHAWEPPSGLSLALAGGRCDDPCGLYLDRLEGLIETFDVPIVPASDDPPGDGGSDPDDWELCPGRKFGGWLDLERCGIRPYPPEIFEEEWRGPWTPPDPGDPWGPFVNPGPLVIDVLGPVVNPLILYGIDPPEYFGEGVLDMTPAFGGRGPDVAGALEEVIGNAGIDPDVRVLDRNEAVRMEGFRPAAAVSPSDTVVLVVDDMEKVVHTGHVPAGRALRNAGTAIPGAVSASNTALAEASAARGEVAGLSTRVDSADARLTEIGAFRQEIVEWKSVTDNRLEGLGDVGGRLSTLERRTELAERELDRSTQRIDQILLGGGRPLAPIDREREFDTRVVEVLGTVRTAVEEAAEGPQETRVREVLERGEEAFTRLESEAAEGTLVLSRESEALGTVLGSVVEALGAAGAPAERIAEIRRLERDLMNVIR